MKTEIRNEQVSIYVYKYFCRYCSFTVKADRFTNEGKETIKTHIIRHWFLQKILPGKNYYMDYVVEIEKRDRQIYLCETCNFESKYYDELIDHELDHLQQIEVGYKTFFYCKNEQISEYFKGIKIGDWFYNDENDGYISLDQKITNLEKELAELKKAKNEVV